MRKKTKRTPPATRASTPSTAITKRAHPLSPRAYIGNLTLQNDYRKRLYKVMQLSGTMNWDLKQIAKKLGVKQARLKLAMLDDKEIMANYYKGMDLQLIQVAQAAIKQSIGYTVPERTTTKTMVGNRVVAKTTKKTMKHIKGDGSLVKFLLESRIPAFHKEAPPSTHIEIIIDEDDEQL